MILTKVILNYFLFCVLFFPASSFSQTLLSTTGGELDTNGLKISFSMGELATTTVYQSNFILTQGFHQSSLTVLNIAEPIKNIEVSIYPNPTSSFIKVYSSAFTNDKYTALIFDARGNRLFEKSISTDNPEVTIDTQEWASGTYFLNLTQPDSKQINTYKIIKSHD